MMFLLNPALGMLEELTPRVASSARVQKEKWRSRHAENLPTKVGTRFAVPVSGGIA
jgi:hypothetical protein